MSLRDTSKVLQSSFASSAPLPEELQIAVEAFLEKHPLVDDNDAQRLHDELLNIYHKSVAGFPGKHGPFVAVLRQLRPAIKTQDQLGEWWDLVIKPTIDSVGHKRDTVADAKDFILSVLVFDSEEDRTGDAAKLSAHFLQRLLDAYLVRTRIPTRDGPAASPEDDFVAHEIESVLVAFGRKKPKELLAAINDLFITKKHRTQSLGLLSAFVRLQPPHLYLVLETSLIDNLLRCLLTDTSAIAVDLALTILIMFLPHITSALVSYLPRLLLVYTRILCWDRYGAPSKVKKETLTPDLEQHAISDAVQDLQKDYTWEQLQHSTDNFESNAPRVAYLFTFLYGLFPINFMSFVRKPRKYLKQANLPGAEHLDFDQDIIRTRTEPYRITHLLHPGFYMSTAEEELNRERWLKSDPADLVTECMGLCVAVNSTLKDPGPPPTTKLPQVPSKPSSRPVTRGGLSEAGGAQDDMTLVDDVKSNYEGRSKPASWRFTRSTAHGSISSTLPIDIPSLPKLPLSPLFTKMPVGSPDSPTLPPIIIKESNDDIPEKPLTVSRPNSTVWRTAQEVTTPSLETFTEALSRVQFPTPPPPGAVSPTSEHHINSAVLQRELMLLRNDLNFERYLKQQHLSHIGALQRKHIKDAATDAETQNLINTNKALKQKLLKANQAYAVLKKEFQTGRTQSKKWESELSNKVRNYREDEKQWQSDSQSLKVEFEKVKRDSEHLRRMVVESEARELVSQQKLRSLEQDLAELEKTRKEVLMLQDKVRLYEAREVEHEHTVKERGLLRTELELANMKLSSREHDREMQAQVYERQITELESRIQQSMPMSMDTMPMSVQQMLDSALAASQAQMAGLKRGHQLLLARYTELEARYLELGAEVAVSQHQQQQHQQQHQQQPKPKAGKQPEAEPQPREVPPVSSQLGRRNSVASTSSGGRGGFFKRHAFSDPSREQQVEDEGYGEQIAPQHFERPMSSATNYGTAGVGANYIANNPFARPSGFGAPAQYQRPASHIGGVHHDFGGSHEYDYDNGHDGGAGGHAFNAPRDSNDHRGEMGIGSSFGLARNTSQKVTTQSRVRVYGRGGGQNIGSKVKDAKKEPKPPSTPTTSKPTKLGGTLRSMRGFVS